MMKRQIDAEDERLQGAIEMAGLVCHELSQPMQCLFGYSEMLLMNSSDDDPHYKKIKAIKEQVERMGVFLGRLMDIERSKTDCHDKNTNYVDIERSLL